MRTHGETSTSHDVRAPAATQETAAPDHAALLTLQRMAGNAAVSSAIDAGARSPVLDVVGRGGGRPLETDVRSDMEASLGHDFSDVRIHTDQQASESAKSVQAQAYTVGNELVFGDGKYAPGTDDGRSMIAHELTHVVQQRSGPVDGQDAPGGIRISDPGDRFEQEASRAAE